MPNIFKIYGYIFVRPRRWFFRKMFGGSYLRILPKREDYFGWRMPNIHWWILYRTIFRLFKWMYWDAWRKLCTYENGWLKHKPFIAKIIHRVGSTTAGFAISGGECFHCSSVDGNPVYLSDPDYENGEYFELTESGVSSTQEGTDHWFKGITTCPRCGYKQEYGDGSL